VTPAIVGACVFFFWCIVPFIVINVALIHAVEDTADGGATIDELQSTNRNFRLKFGWAINKYRTFPHPWETNILGEERDAYIFLTACSKSSWTYVFMFNIE